MSETLEVRRAIADDDGAPTEHHRAITGGAARAAIFGISDGLLTNVSLILGVAGASPVASVVRLAGIAGLVAGAFSMAAGEYVSMSAQAELIARELDVERGELERHPESERRELAYLYRQRGVPRDIADQVSAAVMKDPQTALEVHAREELGVNPHELGSPVRAAGSSFVSFAVGAVIPLLPWFFSGGSGAVLASVVLGTLTAILIGALLGQFTGRSRLRGAARQLLVAAVAAAVTYWVGTLVGQHPS